MIKAMFKTWASALLCVSLSVEVAASPTIRERTTDLRALLTDPARQWAANTTVSFPGSTNFDNATERYSIFNQPTYSAAVSPGTEGDISKVINLAKSYNFPFLARAGGHGGANMSDFESGVSLDLSKFNSIVIDSAAQTMTVGPGVHYRDIFDPLYNAGFYIQTGSCSCPSVIGVAIGGGVGRLMGKLGLTTDALQSVRLVGADGVVKTVSATSYPDLWWAIRGAGANYGVITSATFKIQPLSNNNGGNAFMLDFVLPAEKSLEYLNIIEKSFNPMPVNLAGIIVFNWNSTHNVSQVVSDWIFFGTEADARKTLAPILALNATFITATLPWNRIITVSGGGSDALNCMPNKLRNTFNLNLKTYSAAGWQQSFETLTDFLQKYPGGRGSQVILELFANNATAAVPSSETSWPWRDVRGFFQELFVYDTGDSVTAQGAATYGSQLRSQFAPYSGYSTPTVFVNYARGDEKIEDIYGADKLPRLAQLKQKYDPNNLFAYGHPIPLSYP
ncbi:FAD-binding PCMH-type domain-containing protein [Trichoderma simmonsii]|uniref:FAD-binding PCMH-type domain-containing protein n=1 Tax=Trichoderma simmonsii TaxID=1491479 RepID=A0A8G0PF53_9HYPO|nr:FAD-binding PCMH-type domain-containing protein [Trichoderma simmonsii]